MTVGSPPEASERPVRRRWVSPVLGAALLVGAAVVLVLQVQVSAGAAGGTRACGSAWDVVAGRVGWEEWWAEDLDAPAGRARPELVRTLECPSAVNLRVVVAGALAAAGVAALVVGALVSRRSRVARRVAEPEPVRRWRRFGVVVGAVGAVLTVGGLGGLALLLAHPEAALFLYVDRPTAALVGALLLAVPVVLVAAGWAAVVASRRIEHGGEADGTA